MTEYLIYAAVVALFARTWTEEKLFAEVQDWLGRWPERIGTDEWGPYDIDSPWRRYITSVLSCYYCVANWITLIGLATVRPEPIVGSGFAGYGVTWAFVTALAIVMQDAFRWLRYKALVAGATYNRVA